MQSLHEGRQTLPFCISSSDGALMNDSPIFRPRWSLLPGFALAAILAAGFIASIDALVLRHGDWSAGSHCRRSSTAMRLPHGESCKANAVRGCARHCRRLSAGSRSAISVRGRRDAVAGSF